LTIEYKSELPRDLRQAFGNRVFGCDACQDVCPYNRKAQPHNEPRFDMSDRLRSLTKNQWQNITERDYEELFTGSAVKHTGFVGLRRNIDFVMTEDSGIE
jgi:epoxyqueuosine reductase